MENGNLLIKESMSEQMLLMEWLDELMMELKDEILQKKDARWVKAKDH